MIRIDEMRERTEKGHQFPTISIKQQSYLSRNGGKRERGIRKWDRGTGAMRCGQHTYLNSIQINTE